MIDKVLNTIRKYRMLDDGDSAVCALSGGADSVSLLLVLKELGYDVRAVHVNHNLRGDESLRDERFCIDLCRDLGVELSVESVDVLSYCKLNKLSLEDGARRLRYAAIEKHLNSDRLCTAHNLNDCFETTLFNLVRGCSVSGLTGIPPVRDNIVRPLIEVTKDEILDYLKRRNQDYVTDSTNLEDDCSRNIIRLNVVPELLRINPSLYKTYSASLQNFKDADGYIESVSKELLNAARDKDGFNFFGSRDNIALSGAIKLMLREKAIEPSSMRISKIKSLVFEDGRINISKGVYVRGKSGKITFEYEKTNDDFFIPAVPDKTYNVGRFDVTFTEISQFDISDYNNRSLKCIIDPNKLCGELVIRSYCGNETIKLCGRNFNSTVKKLLAKLPVDERKKAIVVSDDKGAVFVQGFGVASRVFCGSETASAVKIDIIDRKDV